MAHLTEVVGFPFQQPFTVESNKKHPEVFFAKPAVDAWKIILYLVKL